MVNIPSIEELAQAGVHFGHRVSKAHPKMMSFIYTVKNNVHLIDLEMTQKKLKEALNFLQQIAAEGGVVLFVGTKPSAKMLIEKYALEANCPYVSERWLGGTLTNFSVIHQQVERYKKMLKEKEENEWEKYTKKEKLLLERELARLDKLLKGISNLDNLPSALYIVDVVDEITAVREAKKKGIPVVAITDTNANPEYVSYPIPANDDAIKSVEMITKLVAEAIKEGRNQSDKARIKKTEEGDSKDEEEQLKA